ncbi:MAG: type II toxin-antitoxin system HicA family toxin [Bacteroidetes bacterium]|nr:MAG: type II toxin-antitoxin system HicA family toxin [Bacteroidota bacterium]
MSERLAVVSGKDFIKFLQKIGFAVARINGSHHRMRHPDGRVTTVPVHRNDDLPKGLFRKIIREDLKLEQEEFNKLYAQYGK